MSRTTRARLAAGLFIVSGTVLLAAAGAAAWTRPATDATGGTCRAGQRTPIVWTVHNRENGYPGSPAHLTDVATTPVFPTAGAGQVLPNTGDSTAALTTTVPPTFHGTVTLTYRLVWSGTAGSDSRPGTVQVTVIACPVGTPVTGPPGACGHLGTSTTQPPCATTSTTTTTTTRGGCTYWCPPPPCAYGCPPPTTICTTTTVPTTAPPTTVPPTTAPPTTAPPVTTPTTAPPTTEATTTTTEATTTSTEAPTTTSTVPSTTVTTAATTTTTAAPTTTSTAPAEETTTSTAAPLPSTTVTTTGLFGLPRPATTVYVLGRSETLPVTGSDAMPLAVAGGALVAGGVFVVRRSNRVARR